MLLNLLIKLKWGEKSKNKRLLKPLFVQILGKFTILNYAQPPAKTYQTKERRSREAY